MQARCMIDSETIVIADTSSDSSSLQTEISRFDEEGSSRKPKSGSTRGLFPHETYSPTDSIHFDGLAASLE
jgi:hypothetical protein